MQVVQFVLSIIIARILSPEEYGVIAVLMIFLSVATIFVQAGLGTALIQKKEATADDFGFVFTYSLLISFLLYGLLYLLAPYMAGWFSLPELVPITRVAALVLIIGACNSLQVAYATKRMLFKKLFISNVVSAIGSGIVGVVSAYGGFGSWALVYQYLSFQLCSCVMLSVTVAWFPVPKWPTGQSVSLFRFGTGLLGANLIDKLYHNFIGFIIGKSYSSTILALFEKGKQFPLILMDNIDGSVQSVMLPVYSQHQGDPDMVKSLLRRSISLGTYLSFLAMAALAACGTPLVLFLLGEKWMGCIRFLWCYCLISALFPMQTANLQALLAVGKSKLYFRLILYKRIIGFVLIGIIAIYARNIYWIIGVCGVLEIIAILINSIPNKRILSYTLSEMWADVWPNMIVAIILFFMMWPLSLLPISNLSILLLQGLACVAIVPIVSYLLKIPGYIYIVERNILGISEFGCRLYGYFHRIIGCKRQL